MPQILWLHLLAQALRLLLNLSSAGPPVSLSLGMASIMAIELSQRDPLLQASAAELKPCM